MLCCCVWVWGYDVPVPVPVTGRYSFLLPRFWIGGLDWLASQLDDMDESDGFGLVLRRNGVARLYFSLPSCHPMVDGYGLDRIGLGRTGKQKLEWVTVIHWYIE